MSNKLFVGGLAWATTDQGLKAAFAAHGEVVDAKVISDRETGRSRGFGFVTYADSAAAQQAIQKMDGYELDGRNIRVNEAQERSRPGGGGGGRPPGGRPGGGGFGGDRRPGGGGGGRPGGGRPGGGERNYPPVERRGFGGGGGGGDGAWAGGGGGGGGGAGGGAGFPDEGGKPAGRKRHNGGGKRRGGGSGRRGGGEFEDNSDW